MYNRLKFEYFVTHLLRKYIQKYTKIFIFLLKKTFLYICRQISTKFYKNPPFQFFTTYKMLCRCDQINYLKSKLVRQRGKAKQTCGNLIHLFSLNIRLRYFR